MVGPGINARFRHLSSHLHCCCFYTFHLFPVTTPSHFRLIFHHSILHGIAVRSPMSIRLFATKPEGCNLLSRFLLFRKPEPLQPQPNCILYKAGMKSQLRSHSNCILTRQHIRSSAHSLQQLSLDFRRNNFFKFHSLVNSV